MTDAVIVAIITGGFSLAGIILSAVLTARKTDATIRTSQAVTETKLEELTREVREHNNFAQKVPVLEEKISVANNRISDLERITGG